MKWFLQELHVKNFIIKEQHKVDCNKIKDSRKCVLDSPPFPAFSPVRFCFFFDFFQSRFPDN